MKKPAMSLKEKRAAKRAKKDTTSTFIPPEKKWLPQLKKLDDTNEVKGSDPEGLTFQIFWLLDSLVQIGDKISV